MSLSSRKPTIVLVTPSQDRSGFAILYDATQEEVIRINMSDDDLLKMYANGRNIWRGIYISTDGEARRWFQENQCPHTSLQGTGTPGIYFCPQCKTKMKAKVSK